MTVRTQKWQRRRKKPRWSYVIEQRGEPLFVSPYRYSTSEAAQKAGEKDAAMTRGET